MSLGYIPKRLKWRGLHHGSIRSTDRFIMLHNRCSRAFSTNTGNGGGGGMFPELDEETKKQKERKQQIILERMRRSKLADAMRMENEKLFEAGAKPLAEQDSFIFPETEIEPLFEDASDSLESLSIHGLTRRSDVTLLTLSFNGIGKQQANAFNNVFLDVFNPPGRSTVWDSQTNIVDIHYYDGLAYSILKRFLKNGLRKSTQQQSPQLKNYSYVKFERYVPQTEEFLFDAQVHNRAMGYAYLLDSEGRVRWRAHQYATENELEGMIQSANTLLGETTTPLTG